MANMLSYLNGRSTAFVYDKKGTVEYPDENDAREIMQLFTTGLEKIHSNGTRILGQDSSRQRVYTNDDIEEYTRAWTGFISENTRGNIEGEIAGDDKSLENLVDPMTVKSKWRDPFPKMGLNTYM